MPTYAYACRDCGHDFEVVQSFTDDSLTHCPVCSGQLRKVFANVGVVFKGSGFYRNDSRGPDTSVGEKKSTEKSSTDKSAPGDKGSTDKKSSDAKSADATKKSSDKTSGSSKSGSPSTSGAGSAA